MIDYIARNIAQLPIQVFRRVSDTDRIRLFDHPVAQWLWEPNGSTAQYRLIESFVGDICISWMACWLKVRMPLGRIGLIRIPPQQLEVLGWLLPRALLWTTPDGIKQPLDLDDIVFAQSACVTYPIRAAPAALTLRSSTLAEEASARVNRASYWANAARIEGVIERPATAPKWTADQKQSFREQWQSRFAGPRNSGQTPVLEDGMAWKATAFSAKDSEYIEARKLTAEECARAFHVPLPMVGILDHATYSNVKEQHKQLYQDTLRPVKLRMAAEGGTAAAGRGDDIFDSVYIEVQPVRQTERRFPKSRRRALQGAGRPADHATANEGRAQLNLPAIHATIPPPINSRCRSALTADGNTVAPEQARMADTTLDPNAPGAETQVKLYCRVAHRPLRTFWPSPLN